MSPGRPPRRRPGSPSAGGQEGGRGSLPRPDRRAPRAPRAPEAPEALTLELGTAVAAGGDGLGRLPDGRVAFVEGGLPGEVVDVVTTEVRRDLARARVTSVRSASPQRVAAPCPWAAICGGCQWQHVDPAAQAELKAQVVADSFTRIARIPPPPGPPPRRIDPDGYRTTLRLAVGPDGRPALRRRHGHDAVAVDRCTVAHPLLEDLLRRTRLRPPAAGAAPEVTLRVGVAGGERLVLPGRGAVVVEAPVDAVVALAPRPGAGPGSASPRPAPSSPPPMRPGAVASPARHPGAEGATPPQASAVVHEAVGGRTWRVSGWSFFQSGPAAASLLCEMVDAAVGPLPAGAAVVDLYAGVGVLGGVLAARADGARLTAVESSPQAAADAVANLADLDAVVAATEVSAWTPVPADVVVADPSRSGLGRPGVAAVAATGAPRVVLVSCDPASAARDAALLAGAGYACVELAVADLFPQTVHVEAVAVYERRG